MEVLIEENEDIYLRAPPNAIILLLFFLETSPSICSYPVWSRSFLSVFVIIGFSHGLGLREGKYVEDPAAACPRALCHIPVCEGTR